VTTDPGFRFDTTYTRLPQAFYTALPPQPVAAPETVIVNHALAETLGLDLSALDGDGLANLFSGNTPPAGATPFAQAYAGHQFGHFTMLGDGRAVVWGEHVTPDGTRVDLQFKGSGRTPYSRGGDGRAALGPMLREYIVSEAMHALKVPTTRALAVVKTGEAVFRDTPQPGAILTRVARSHIRVGTFQYAAAHRDPALLPALFAHALERHFPEAAAADTPALAVLDAMAERQAALIAEWMRVGFIHGVMNTDNVALSGETIDYGPCAFMDVYDPATVFSSIDRMGRYAYANQPVIAQWNLARFAETLLPLIDADTDAAIAQAEKRVNGFPARFKTHWLAMMRRKLGLFGEREGDEALISDLLDWMHTAGADYTNTFRDLTRALAEDRRPAGEAFDDAGFAAWHARWTARLGENPKPTRSSLCLMRAANPAVIPRNHKVEEALAAANRTDLRPLHDLLDALADPYTDRPDRAAYTTPPAAGERVLQTFCGT